MTITWTRAHWRLWEEMRIDLEYVSVDFADKYWRGVGKEKRRIKGKSQIVIILCKYNSLFYQIILVVSSENFSWTKKKKKIKWNLNLTFKFC